MLVSSQPRNVVPALDNMFKALRTLVQILGIIVNAMLYIRRRNVKECFVAYVNMSFTSIFVVDSNF